MSLSETPTSSSSARRYDVVGEIIAWFVIAACVALIVAPPLLPRFRAEARTASPQASFQLNLLGRYVVGAHRTLGMDQNAATLVQQVESIASTEIDSLKVVAIVAELQGKDEALQRLRGREWSEENAQVAGALEDVYERGPGDLSSASAGLLRDELGWFAKLALSHDRDPGDPIVQEVQLQAKRAFFGLFGYLLFVGALALGGLILLVLAIVMLATGNLLFSPTPLHTPGAPFVEGFAIYLASFIGLSVVITRLEVHGMSWSFLLTVSLPIALLWCRIRAVSWNEIREAIGWTRGDGIVKEFACGAIGWVTGAPIIVAGFVVSALLTKLVGSEVTHPLTGEVGRSSFLMLFLLASVWAPFMEETTFRGLLFHGLRVRVHWVLSAIISAVIFAAIHPQGWTFIPALGSIGFVLAAIRQWRGSIIASMVCHALVNTLTLTLLWMMTA